MKRLLIINNIPTPYRTFMFNKMHEKGLELGIETSVAFQARREARRSWKPEDFDMRFPYCISTGLGLGRIKPKEYFSFRVINVDIIAEVGSGRYDWVMMSPFMSVTNLITSVQPAGKTIKLLWSESHALSSRHQGWLAQRSRRFLCRRYAALICPGRRAVEFVLQYDPRAAEKPVIYLPNIVDSSIFIHRVKEYRKRCRDIRTELGIKEGELLIVGVGRITSAKGFDLLIDAAAKAQGNYRVVLLGGGPFRDAWLSRIADLGLANKVSMPGECSQEVLARYLASADWFIHPARLDASPLVTIEATCSGLPLAISKQTGNSPETIEEGVNGFTFDPCHSDEMIGCLQRILATDAERRREMGAASARMAKERFDPDMVVDRFFQCLLGLSN